MKITTDYWRKPIPTNKADWTAWDADRCGCRECHQPVGYGATEAEALADLNEKMAEETECHARCHS